MVQDGLKLQIFLEDIQQSEYRLQYIKTLLFAVEVDSLTIGGDGSIQVKIPQLVKQKLTIEVNLGFWKRALENPALERRFYRYIRVIRIQTLLDYIC